MIHPLTFHRHFSESFAEQRRIFWEGGPETSTPSVPAETNSPEVHAPDDVETVDSPDDAREDSAENQDEATQEEVHLATRQFEIFLRQEQLVGLLRERMMANRRDRYHTNREALTLSRMRNRFQPAQQAKIQELFQRVQMLSAYDTTLTRQYEEQVRRMNRMNPHHSSYDEAVFREPVPALDGLPQSFPRGGPSGAPSGVPQESSAAPQSETLSYDQLEPERKKIVDDLLKELNELPSGARQSHDGKPTAAASRILGALLMQGVDAESSLTKPQIGNEDITIYRMGTLPFILSVIKGISYQFQSFFGKLENSGEDGEDDMDRKTRDELKDAIDAKKEEIEKLEEEPDDEKPDDKSKREKSLESAKEELVKLEEALARNLWKNAAILSLKQSTKKKFSDTTLTDDSFKNSAKEILQFFQTVLREKTDAAPTNISLEDALTTEKRTKITEQLVQLAEQVAPALCPVRQQDGSFNLNPRFAPSLPDIYAGSLKTSFDNIDDFIQHIEEFEEKNKPSTSPTSERGGSANAPSDQPELAGEIPPSPTSCYVRHGGPTVKVDIGTEVLEIPVKENTEALLAIKNINGNTCTILIPSKFQKRISGEEVKEGEVQITDNGFISCDLLLRHEQRGIVLKLLNDKIAMYDLLISQEGIDTTSMEWSNFVRGQKNDIQSILKPEVYNALRNVNHPLVKFYEDDDVNRATEEDHEKGREEVAQWRAKFEQSMSVDTSEGPRICIPFKMQ